MINPLISVIVPVYKVEKYLDRCVESIVNQTYTNLEIILVDDGSPDNCPAMCDSWAKKDSRIKVVHKENGGVSSARNAALSIASGKYISFIDSDDYISKDMYSTLIGKAEEYDADVIRCTYTAVNDNSAIGQEFEVNNDVVVITDKNEMLNSLHQSGNKTAFIANKIFKRSVLKNVRFNENFSAGEDVLFVYSAFENSNIVVFYDIPLYYYRVHDEQCNSKKDFNYQCFRTFDYLTDNNPAIMMYFKFFIFCGMTIHDAILEMDYDLFQHVRLSLMRKRKKVRKALFKKRSLLYILKFYLIIYFPTLYKNLLYRRKHNG